MLFSHYFSFHSPPHPPSPPRISTVVSFHISIYSLAALQNRDGGDRARSSGGGDFQRSDSSPGSRPSSVLPDLLTSSPGQRQDKSTSEEVRHLKFILIYIFSFQFSLSLSLFVRVLIYSFSLYLSLFPSSHSLSCDTAETSFIPLYPSIHSNPQFILYMYISVKLISKLIFR